MSFLTCGCCGQEFKAEKQHWDSDKGYGHCPKCCEWILSNPRWKDQHEMIIATMLTQWPEETGKRLREWAEIGRQIEMNRAEIEHDGNQFAVRIPKPGIIVRTSYSESLLEALEAALIGAEQNDQPR